MRTDIILIVFIIVIVACNITFILIRPLYALMQSTLMLCPFTSTHIRPDGERKPIDSKMS